MAYQCRNYLKLDLVKPAATGKALVAQEARQKYLQQLETSLRGKVPVKEEGEANDDDETEERN
jgi:hypothetical protein